ncbi:hypothetical protein H6P81_011080 [Aristolochia fimbriata]|uniref:Uncharacterized protein n=1 Tax=Aristolochia fimbriata TaxID=158543 RepID=A0AAV7EQI8_ARIFI|nr:hypothetical protein H6P81_011080 [Aristolochia fimbriata]
MASEATDGCDCSANVAGSDGPVTCESGPSGENGKTLRSGGHIPGRVRILGKCKKSAEPRESARTARPLALLPALWLCCPPSGSAARAALPSEEKKRRWHMLSGPAFGTTVADSSVDSFFKDGRKIAVGDCALFQAGNSPPFIGIIRSLSSSKEDNYPRLGVNWLYRPADIKLAKGILLEAAPNEVFYSFHKDEIPAASLLHPCKVAFLRKGVELPPGISSFVCRRVYDIANKCLWWLTDQDYINERQEEVDQLLDKTRLEMHAAVQSGGRSPKTLSGPTSSQQLKPGSDSVQNSSTSFPSQGGKSRKRERSDQGSEPIKRERPSKPDDGDSCHFKPESSMIKAEIAKLTDKEGGLTNLEGVEKLVHLMQLDKAEKKIDLVGRIMLADVIAATERYECLGRFVQLRGVPILDDWLQEVHKGKLGDGSSPKESDKSVEELLLALLRALDKLPVNLHALQTSNVGKSVNHLRSHKNLEIQRKARSLVDTWKKRVEAEMKMNDAKSGPTQTVSWPGKTNFPDVSHGGNRRSGSSSEVVKSSITQPSASKSASVKFNHGDPIVKPSSSSPGPVKLNQSVPSVTVSSKGASDLPLTPIKEERSSSSSQSQNNSQSCSGDHAKTTGSTWKEDARSSTAGSISANRSSTGGSRSRKSSNGFVGSGVSGSQKETVVGKPGSTNKNTQTDKVSQSGLTSEKVADVPAFDHGNSHRLIVRLPNPGRSPSRSASGGSLEEPSVVGSRASSPGVPDKQDVWDRKTKGKADGRHPVVADVNTESWQSNDVKDGLGASDEGERSPAPAMDEERIRITEENAKSLELSKGAAASPASEKAAPPIESKSGKLYESSYSSMNALIESCVKYSEAASASLSVGDDLGMNLLASVAAGEMSKSDAISPSGSPQRNLPAVDDSFAGNNPAKLRLMKDDGAANSRNDADEGTDGDPEKQDNSIGPVKMKGESQPPSLDLIANNSISGDGKNSLTFCEQNEPLLEQDEQIPLSRESDARPDETVDRGPVASVSFDPISSTIVKEEAPQMEGTPLREKKKSTAGGSSKGDRYDAESVVSTLKDEEAVEESTLCQTPVTGSVNMGAALERSAQEQGCPPVTVKHVDVALNISEDVISSASQNLEEDCKPGKTEIMETVCNSEPNSKEDATKTNLDHTELNDPVGGNKDDGTAENSFERKEAPEPDELPSGTAQESEKCEKSAGSKLSGAEAAEAEECVSTAEVSSTPALDTATKLDFDLNEGFPSDDGNNQGEPVSSTAVPGRSSAVHLHSPLPFSGTPISTSGLSAPIPVAAAAKGAFVPPENLLKSKVELGWKGSAATSAFRPAEPRKNLELLLVGAEGPSADNSVGKQGRAALNIDLNVPDERVLEDLASQTANPEPNLESVPVSNPSSVRSSGGLDLDLNRVDESAENGQFSINTTRRMEVPPLMQGRLSSSSSAGFPNGEVNVLRDFDLNNGPGLDEAGGSEPAPRNQQIPKTSVPFVPPIPGIRINNSELGSISSWFPHANSYSAVAIQSFLPDRAAEQPYPVVASSGTHQRILGSAAGGTFGGDLYRGPVLSSAASMPFPPPAAAAFSYGGFPFGTNFPLSSTSFSGGSTYMDSTSGGGPCFPAVPSQLVGPAGPVQSHFPRPYVISLPESSTTSGSADSSRKWGRQGLDLNAGPGSIDVEGRDERMPSASSRQLSVASSQTLAEEQARMYQAVKRKEPEGGWGSESLAFKQPSWQ